MATPVPLAPLARDASQTDRAILGIRDLVLRGEFKAGERLPELALAELLGVSRTPIRAALQKLAEEGLLEPATSTGYLVRSFSDNDIFDAIEVRGTIEGLAGVTALPFAAADAFVAAQAEIPGSLEILKFAQLQHHEIVDAIEARSSARAEPLVREHSRNARKNLELALRNGEAMKHFPGAPLIRRRGV